LKHGAKNVRHAKLGKVKKSEARDDCSVITMGLILKETLPIFWN